ncbi:MAG TPA: hypothetical protein VFT46_03550, partial [Holophagaceae bacterium]|nr:hypothetical protein [Holophagaceae bacterium]
PPADDAAAGSPFARLWTRGAQAPPERLRLAALALAAAGDTSAADTARKLADLRPGLKDPQEAIAADVALAIAAHTAQQPELGLAASARLIQEAPQSLQAMRIRLGSLTDAGRIPEAIAYAQARMAEHPELEDLQSDVSQLQGSLGRFEEGERGLQSLIDRGRASATDYNNLAWSQVVRGAVTDHTLDLIRTATQSRENASSEHTLAVVLADLGRTTEAKALLLKEMDLRDADEPGGNEWYVLGRIAEQLGIPEAARACYGRVKAESPREAADRMSCPTLAAQRLAALKAAP